MTEQKFVLVDAHRGASASFPENTLAALEAGVAAGADSVEFDVEISDNLFTRSNLRNPRD